MSTEISVEDAVDIISNAFSPLHCGAEMFDYRYIRFRIFDANDEGILRMERVTPDDYGFPKSLQSIIEHARSNLIRLGHSLNGWHMPSGPWQTS